MDDVMEELEEMIEQDQEEIGDDLDVEIESSAVDDNTPEKLKRIIETIKSEYYRYTQHQRARQRVDNHIRSIKYKIVGMHLREKMPDWWEMSNKDQFNAIKKDAPNWDWRPMPEGGVFPFEYTYLIEHSRIATESEKLSAKVLVNQVAKLRCYRDWIAGIRGSGAINIAKLIGEAGDLSDYLTSAKIKKRMCVAPGQKKSKDKDSAIDMGYSPRRRAVMWNIEAGLIRASNKSYVEEHGEASHYKKIYDERKAYEATKTLFDKKTETDKPLTRMHAHRRAQRYMGQVFLEDLWAEWTKAYGISKRAHEIAAEMEKFKAAKGKKKKRS